MIGIVQPTHPFERIVRVRRAELCSQCSLQRDHRLLQHCGHVSIVCAEQIFPTLIGAGLMRGGVHVRRCACARVCVVDVCVENDGVAVICQGDDKCNTPKAPEGTALCDGSPVSCSQTMPCSRPLSSQHTHESTCAVHPRISTHTHTHHSAYARTHLTIDLQLAAQQR